MASRSKQLKNITKFFTENWFLSVFFACIMFVGLISFYRLFVAKDNFVYARVKVSQGLWWANTNRPPSWFLSALKPGMTDKGLTGKPNAKLLTVVYYPYYGSSQQYDIYLTLKLKVSRNKSTGSVNYNRSSLAVGSPIDLVFPSIELSGTVMEMSPRPFKKKLVEKTLTLINFSGFQWQYDAIKIGDSYFNGETTTAEVLDKEIQDNPQYGIFSASPDLFAEPKKIITVKVKAKLRKQRGVYVYGEDQEIKINKGLSLSTNSFVFEGFQVMSID